MIKKILIFVKNLLEKLGESKYMHSSQNNLKEIRKKRNKKCSCDCGGKYTCTHKSQHLINKRYLDRKVYNGAAFFKFRTVL